MTTNLTVICGPSILVREIKRKDNTRKVLKLDKNKR